MLRSLMIWMALCLGLAVMWQLAQLAAGRDELFEQHDSAQGTLPAIDELRHQMPHDHPCQAWSQECRQLRCEVSQAAFHVRLQ